MFYVIIFYKRKFEISIVWKEYWIIMEGKDKSQENGFSLSLSLSLSQVIWFQDNSLI